MTIALAVTVSAQQLKPLSVSQDQSVPNDDRGEAFIIDRNVQPLSSVTRARKGGISEPEQYSIFVGADWSSSDLHEREAKLSSLLESVTDDAELSVLQESGIKNRFAPTSSAERLDLPAGTFTDLEAQRMLSAMLADSLLPRPSASAIYVIYLDSHLQSTLGTLVAGKHYAAYHSAFNSAGVNIRYVVIPFESEAGAGYQIALRAFVAAALKSSHPIAK